MAYGTLIDIGFQNNLGEGCEILLERDGYGGTVYDSTSQVRGGSWTIKHGSEGKSFRRKRANLLSTVELSVIDDTLMGEMRKIPAQPSRAHRLTLSVDGQTRFKGFVKPDATETPRHPTTNGSVTVQGKDNVKALGSDWLDSNGDEYQASTSFRYNDAIAGILSKLGLSLPIEVVTRWRPKTMDGTDHPLDLVPPTAGFYPQDSGGTSRPMTRADVLESLLQSLGCTILQERGVWKILEPGAFESGTDVTVWEYDSTGTYQQSTTRPTTIDVSNEAWEPDSDSVGGEIGAREVEVTYEHNADTTLPLNGGFEIRDPQSSDRPEDWLFYENGVQVTFPNGPFDNAPAEDVIEGDWATRIEGQKAASGTAASDLYQTAEDWGEGDFTGNEQSARREQWVQGSEELEFRLRANFPTTGDVSGEVTDAKIHWGLRGENTESGTVYYYVDGAGWKTQANLTEAERKNGVTLTVNADDSIDPVDQTITIEPPPESVDPYIQIFQPTSVPSTSSPSYVIYAIYDALEVRRKASAEQPYTTFRGYDQEKEEGSLLEVSVRVGDGPWAGSGGDIFDADGNNTDTWQILGESGTYPHARLVAREYYRLRNGPREVTRINLMQPDSVPRADRAVVWEGTRYWPMLVKEQQPESYYQLYLLELDRGAGPPDFEIVAGDGETLSSESTGTSSTSGTTSSTDSDGGAAVSSVQGRTGAVEWASEDVGTGLSVDLNTDPNQIGVADNGITAAQIAADAVGSAQIAAGAVGATQIATGAVGATEIADGAVGPDQASTALAGNGLGGGGGNPLGIASSGVTSAEIANDAVGSAEIDPAGIGDGLTLGNALAVEPADFAGSGLVDDGADNLQIASGGVGTSELAADAVTNAKIAAAAVDTTQIVDGAVGPDQVNTALSGDGLTGGSGNPIAIASSGVTGDKIANDAVGAAELDATDIGDGLTLGTALAVEPADFAGTGLVDDGADNLKIADDGVDTAQIALDAVGSAQIAADAVTSTQIAADAVGTTQIAGDAVTGTEIAADAVGATEIGTGAVTGSAIASSAVDTAEIATNAVTSNEVAAGAITSTEIAATAIGDGLTGGGGSTVAIEPADFAGAGLEDDGTDDLRIASTAAGNGLTGGSGSALGIATNGVGRTEIAADAVGATEIGTGAVTGSAIASSAVDTAEIATNAVTSTEIASGAVTNTEIATSAIGDGLTGGGGSDVAVDSTVARTSGNEVFQGEVRAGVDNGVGIEIGETFQDGAGGLPSGTTKPYVHSLSGPDWDSGEIAIVPRADAARGIRLYHANGSGDVFLAQYIAPDGNVGVGGITSPSADLHTNGFRADGLVDFSSASQVILPLV